MSGLEVFGAVVLGIIAIFFPRVVLGVVLMWILEFPLWGLIPLAVVGFYLDMLALGDE